MNRKISAYTILYYDTEFLDHIYNILDQYVDEFIIVDGPYQYCLPFLNKLGLIYNEHNKPAELNRIIEKYGSKIKYYYKVWKDEKEKRMFGYSMCLNDNILLVDTDEFIQIDNDKLNEFIDSDKSVGQFSIFNMNRININIGLKTTKNIIFKRDYVSAFQHLSYIWLILVNNLKIPQNNCVFDKLNIGTIYHQTLNRNKFNSIIKFIFYTRLYHYNYQMNLNTIHGYDIDDLLKKLSVQEILDIFYHSSIDLIGIPKDNILYENKNVNLDLSNYKLNHKQAYYNKNSIMIKNIHYCCYINLNDNINFIKLSFENVKDVDIKLYEISLNKPYIIHNYNFKDINNNVLLEVSLKNKIKRNLCFVLWIKVNNTINDEIICKLADIKILNNYTYKVFDNKIKSKNIKYISKREKTKTFTFEYKLYDEIISLGEDRYTYELISNLMKQYEVKPLPFPFDNVGHSIIEKITKKMTNFEYITNNDIDIQKFGNRFYLVDNKYGFKYWKDIFHFEKEEFTENEINRFIEKYNKRYKRLNDLLNSKKRILFISICNFHFIHNNKYKKKNRLIKLFSVLKQMNENITLLAFNFCEENFTEDNLIHINIPFNNTNNYDESKKNLELEIFNYMNKHIL